MNTENNEYRKQPNYRKHTYIHTLIGLLQDTSVAACGGLPSRAQPLHDHVSLPLGPGPWALRRRHFEWRRLIL